MNLPEKKPASDAVAQHLSVSQPSPLKWEKPLEEANHRSWKAEEGSKRSKARKQKGVKKSLTHATSIANAVKGNISINKDGIEKKVKQDTLQQYLSEGWQLGGKKRKTV